MDIESRLSPLMCFLTQAVYWVYVVAFFVALNFSSNTVQKITCRLFSIIQRITCKFYSIIKKVLRKSCKSDKGEKKSRREGPQEQKSLNQKSFFDNISYTTEALRELPITKTAAIVINSIILLSIVTLLFFTIKTTINSFTTGNISGNIPDLLLVIFYYVLFFFTLLCLLDFVVGSYFFLIASIVNLLKERLGDEASGKRICKSSILIIFFTGVLCLDKFPERKIPGLFLNLIYCIVLLYVGRCLFTYIKELISSIHSGKEFSTKKVAISEIIFINISLILYLSDVTYQLTKMSDDVFVEGIDIPFIECFKFCCLNFIGQGAIVLTPKSEVASSLFFVINVVGFITIGYIIHEIASHITAQNRSEQEAYWRTMYESECILNTINQMLLIINDVKQTDQICNDNKAELTKVRENMPKEINDMHTLNKHRTELKNILQKITKLLVGLINEEQDVKNRKKSEIENELKKYKENLVKIENDLIIIGNKMWPIEDTSMFNR